MGQMVVEDMIESWWQILVGLVVAMFVCLIFIAIMRWLAGPTIWFSIFAVIGLLGYSEYFLIKSSVKTQQIFNSKHSCYSDLL